MLWAFTQQHESPSTGYACPMDSRCSLPHLDNPIQPTWTLASEPCLRESLSPRHRSQQGSRCVPVFTDVSTPAGWRDFPLECWRELSPAPDQVCHQEEIGSNGRGGRCQAQWARVQAALPASLPRSLYSSCLECGLGSARSPECQVLQNSRPSASLRPVPCV